VTALWSVTSDYSRKERDRPVIVVNGRVLSPSAYRPSSLVELENTVEWWTALGVLGALLVSAGVGVAGDAGDLLAVGGVVLFFATAAAAGSDRIETATGLGIGGVAWAATGISLVLVTDRWLGATALALVVTGLVFVGLAVRGGSLARERSKRFSEPPR